MSGRRFDVRVIGAPFAGGVVMNGAAPAGAGAAPRKPRERKRGGGAVGGDTLPSPLQGNMWRVKVRQGDTVEEGQLLCIIEAMKMENEITAHKAGVVAELPIAEGAAIAAGDPIATISSPPPSSAASGAAAREEPRDGCRAALARREGSVATPESARSTRPALPSRPDRAPRTQRAKEARMSAIRPRTAHWLEPSRRRRWSAR